MKYLIIIISIFCFTNISQINAAEQSGIDSLSVYKKAKSAPIWVNKDVNKLANYLTKDFKDQASKVLAITYWVAKNIKYDYSDISDVKMVKSNSKKILWTKKAISNGYSLLFVELCKAVNIKAILVNGYSKEFDFIDGDQLLRTNYDWVLVQINSEWQIIDLTLASGQVELSSNLYQKVFWKLFKRPYSMKYKYIHKYQPQYINIDPKVSILNNYPAVGMFQLLEYPIGIRSFEKGIEAVQKQIERYPETRKKHSQIDAFYNLSYSKQFAQLGQQSYDQNYNNHYDKGMFYTQAIEVFKQRYYIESKERLQAQNEILLPMREYGRFADSLLQLALDDNSEQLNSLKERSKNWQTDLVEYNKFHTDALQERIKKNADQFQIISKTSKQNETMQAYIPKNTLKLNPQDIIDVYRPTEHKNAEMYERIYLLMDVDTLKTNSKILIRQYDSLIAANPKTKAEFAFKKEQEALDLHAKNAMKLKGYIKKRGDNMTLVYHNTAPIYKKSFSTNFEAADSLNMNFTDTLIVSLYNNQTRIFEIMQEYTLNIDTQLKKLREAKKKSFKDMNEDSLYKQTINEYLAQMEVFKKTTDEYLVSIEDFKKVLKKESFFMKESIKHLKKDIKLESTRHKEYCDYRKEVKDVLNDHIREKISELRVNRKLISKALK